MSRRLLPVVAAAILLLAPFREGGRDPLALLVLHTLSLLFVALALGGSVGAGRSVGVSRGPLAWIGGLGGAALLLALLSALRAGYPLAAWLGAWDMVVPAALFLAAGVAGPGLDARALAGAAVASSTIQALLAIGRYAGGGPKEAAASFLNPNHLAAFLNVGFFLSAALALAPRGRRSPWIAAAAIHLPAILLLRSRGAFLALLSVLLVLGAVRRRALTPRRLAAAAGFFVACAILGGLAIHGRFAGSFDPYRYARLPIWRASALMIAERPLLGFGPGMFPYTAPAHNFPAVVGPIRYGRTFQGAHSAYLTIAAETGVPAASCLLAAAVLAAIVLLRRGEKDGEPVFTGGALALMSLLVHAAVDDLQGRPALAIAAALLCGTGLGSAGRAREGEPGKTGAARFDRPGRAVAAAAAIYLHLIAVLLPYLAHREATTALRLGREGLPHMRRAAALNPLHPDYRHDLAMAILNSGPLTPRGYARASSLLLQARRLKPIDHRYPLLLARLEARFAPRLFDDPTAGKRAADLYREAARLAPSDPLPRLELAGHLLDLKRHDEALRTVREALALEPQFVRARLLEASILLEMGRRAEARASLEAAQATLEGLQAYVPDSGYAREIVSDAPAERRRLAASLEPPEPSPGRT